MVTYSALQDVVLVQAEARPDATAFRFDGCDLTYAQLAESSARVSRTLRDAGVRRGDRVAILLNKSLESAIAVFAILRSGAAYVPVDPGAPPKRVEAILKTCGARVVLSHEQMRRHAEEALGGAGLDLVIGMEAPISGVGDTISWAEASAAPEGAEPDLTPDDLAYIIFSSGSTGTPKGITHAHRDALAYASMSSRLYGLHPGDRLGNSTPLHFDMSTFDFFAGPMAGAATVIVPEPYLKLPASLADLIEEERLTIWYSTPFALILLAQGGDLDTRDLSSLRWVLFGGEPFVPKHLAALTRLLPGAAFGNVYGPAEVNQCTYYNLPTPWHESLGQPPIGRDCPGNTHLVVDAEGRIVEDGGTGELLVKTETMMKGYWNAPEMTARSLYASEDGSVFYRTGDLVRRRSDGELVFEGRRDRQVKTRGYLVRLDEVEESLSAHPSVLEVAAYPRDDGEGLVRVEAAVVLRKGETADAEDLRRFAAKWLPAYAVPTAMHIREEFPRTTSGKIDRRQLAMEAGA